MGFIQQAITKIKAIPLERLVELKLEGKKYIRISFAPKAELTGYEPPRAVIPILWVMDALERYQASNKTDEKVFADFQSDWIAGWVPQKRKTV